MRWPSPISRRKETARWRFWDETQLAVALQGLANRSLPQLFLRYIPGSPVWCAPVFCANNIAALVLDRIAKAAGSLGIAALKDGYERGYLAFPESYVIVLRNRKQDGKG